MVFVYPYKKSPDHFDIKQSIAWIKRVYPDATIYTIGDAVDGALNIPCQQFNNIRGIDVTNRILTFANTIGGEFIYMNDDFFCTPNLKPEHPIYKGNLIINELHPPHYQTAAMNTLEFLKYYNRPTLNYETHSPVLMDSKRLIKTFEQVNWKDDNHFIKSIYLNSNVPKKSIEGFNCKINSSNIPTALKYLDVHGCFSTGKAFLDDAGATWIKTLILPPQP
jgi:hypothetical protein